MNNKTKLLLTAAALAVAFAAGRFSQGGPSDSKTEIKQSETQKEEDRSRQTTTVKVKCPDGAEAIATTTTDENHKETRTDNTSIAQNSGRENRSLPLTNLSVLYGVENGPKELYGLSVSRDVLGPITVGAWGLNNGTLGVSLGVNF